MRVPDEAGLGKAKVTVRLTPWLSAAVKPASFDIPVVEPDAEFLAMLRLRNETNKERTERALRHRSWDRDVGWYSSLQNLFYFLQDRYDIVITLDPADFHVKDASDILQTQITIKSLTNKENGKVLEEALQQIKATYVVEEKCIRIVPVKQK